MVPRIVTQLQPTVSALAQPQDGRPCAGRSLQQTVSEQAVLAGEQEAVDVARTPPTNGATIDGLLLAREDGLF